MQNFANGRGFLQVSLTGDKKFMLPLSLVAGHTVLVLLVAWGTVSTKGESDMLWLVPAALDWPITILDYWIQKIDNHKLYTFMRALNHAVLGGLQYYVFGRIFVFWLRRKRFRPGHCQQCDYNLTGLTESRCPECGTRFDPSLHEFQNRDCSDAKQGHESH